MRSAFKMHFSVLLDFTRLLAPMVPHALLALRIPIATIAASAAITTLLMNQRTIHAYLAPPILLVSINAT
jgi:hypothetical protein